MHTRLLVWKISLKLICPLMLNQVCILKDVELGQNDAELQYAVKRDEEQWKIHMVAAMQTRCQVLFMDSFLENSCANTVSTFAFTITLLIMKLCGMMLCSGYHVSVLECVYVVVVVVGGVIPLKQKHSIIDILQEKYSLWIGKYLVRPSCGLLLAYTDSDSQREQGFGVSFKGIWDWSDTCTAFVSIQKF